MNLQWIHESPAQWDEPKARIIRASPPGTFGPDRLAHFGAGALIPGDWWRVEHDGAVVAYGWMDSTWGDAEILLAVDPGWQRRGIGTFVLGHLEEEARRRGFNYLYNAISRAHPDAEGLTAWLAKRDFDGHADGSLRRSIVAAKGSPAS